MITSNSGELFNVIERYCHIHNELCDFDTIWHYTSADGFKSIVEEGEVYFTHNAFLNDSTERTHVFDIADRVLSSYNNEPKNEFIESLSALFNKKKEDPESVDFTDPDEVQVFVFSCSLDKDSLPLWNHYSKNPAKAGFSIGLNLNEIIKLQFKERILQGIGSNLYPVIYDDQEKEKLVKEICDAAYELWNDCNTNQEEIVKEAYAMIRIAGAFLKHKAFESEHEARYILYVQNKHLDCLGNLLKFRNMHGIFTPYIAVPFINNKTLNEVVISPTLRSKQAKSYADLFLRMRGYEIVSETSRVPLRF
ncbi:DUF2971 domain-containing protein [Candidatus Methanomassiliicoccus intestinalis]